MRSRFFILLFLTLLLGCQKSPDAGSRTTSPELAPEAALRLHWVGKRQISLDGGAFYFNRIWELPETRLLEAQKLDQLATAPWRLLGGSRSLSNAPVAQFRWLLESLKYEESYAEIWISTNGSKEFCLAIRLTDKDAKEWQANLAFVVHSLSGFPPMASHGENGWTLDHPDAAIRIKVKREGVWTVVGISKNQYRLTDAVLKRIREHGRPFEESSGWLTVDADLERLKTFSGYPPGGLPKVDITINGDSGNVLTHAKFTFPHPFDEPPGWNLPTKVIREPLTSFTAARGFNPIISEINQGRDTGLGNAPQQFFIWSRTGNPFQIFGAAPFPDAAGKMDALADRLLKNANPWLQNNGPRVNDAGIPQFEKLPDAAGVRWTLPGLFPFIKAVDQIGGSFIVAGLTPDQGSGASVLPNRFRNFDDSTNLLFFNWESTGTRVNDLFPVLQTARLLAHKTPMPDESPSLVWLNSIRSRLRDSETQIRKTGPLTLELERKATLGLTAFELHMIADWLECDSFPAGLRTFTAAARKGESHPE